MATTSPTQTAEQIWQNLTDEERRQIIASIPTREQLNPAIEVQAGPAIAQLETQQQVSVSPQPMQTTQPVQPAVSPYYTTQGGNMPQQSQLQQQQMAQLQAQQAAQAQLLQQQQQQALIQQQQQAEQQRLLQAQAQAQAQQEQKDEGNWFERNWQWLIGLLVAAGVAIFAFFKIKKYKDETKQTQATNSALSEKITGLKDQVNQLKGNSNNSNNSEGGTLANNSQLYTQETVDKLNSLINGKDRI